MSRTRLVMTWIALAALLLPACQTGPGKASGPASSHRLHDTIAPPPRLAALDLEPATDEAERAARLSLEQIVAELPTPDYLPEGGNGADAVSRDDAADPEPTVRDREPALSAQQAYVEGLAAWRNGDSAEAKRRLQAALRLAPDSPEVLRWLGLVYTATGNRVRGAFYLEQAAALDPDDAATLLLLSRFALEQSEWEDAIVGLDGVLNTLASGDASVDPAIEPLTRYYLALSLRSAGYSAAAADQFDRYLRADRRGLRASQWGRELIFLDRQEGQTFLAIGDLLHRLDQAADARKAYDRAETAGVLDASELLQRQVYTDLRLGEADRAIERVVTSVRATEGGATSLELAAYLVEQGVNGDTLATRLETIYRNENRPAGLALAIAQMLPDGRASALLIEHLDEKPTDRPVFEALLIATLPATSPSEARVSEAVRITSRVASAAPSRAGDYITLLLDRTENTESLLNAIAPPVFVQDTPGGNTAQAAANAPDAIALVIRGAALVRLDRADEAIDLYTRAIEADPTLAVARIELAKLLITGGRFEMASRLLQPLAERRDAETVTLRATVLSETGQVPEALALINDALSRGPVDPRLAIQKARLQLRAADPAAAEQTLLDALNARPYAEALYVELFRLYDDSAVPDSIRQYQRLMRRMLGTIPTSRVARLMRAKWLSAQSKFDEAAKLLNELLQENRNDVSAIDELVDVYVRVGKRGEAIALVDELVETNPRNPVALQKAYELFNKPMSREGQPLDSTRALEVARQIIMLGPESPRRTRELAMLFTAMGRSDEAVALLRDAIAQPDAPERELMQLLLWQTLMRADRADEAITLIRETLDDPALENRGSMVELLWRSLAAEEKIDEAIVLLEDELARDDLDDPSSLMQPLWALLIDQNRRDEAEAHVRATMERFPDHAADLGYFWAMMVAQTGEAERSQTIMQDVLRDHPDHAPTNNDLAYVWSLEDRNLDRALEMAERAVAGDPENEAYLDTKGWVYYKLGDFEEATRWLRRSLAAAQNKADELTDNADPGAAPDRDIAAGAIALKQTQAVVGDHLGDALYRQGDKSGAQRAWFRAMNRLTDDVPQDYGDLVGLKTRLSEKIAAIRQGKEPVVASVPGLDDPAPDAEKPPIETPQTQMEPDEL